MERVGRVQQDPYNDLFESPGKEAFTRLFSAEEYFMTPQSYLNDEEKKIMRGLAVDMIESLSSRYIDALIPYTAMTYLDRFLSRNDDFPDGNRRLFVVCCLTIAGKLRKKSFNLSRFLSDRDLSYSAEEVLEMELEICRGLEWRMQTLTPFCFVDFFIKVLNLPPGRPSPHQPVRDLIVRSQGDIAFTRFRPSVMAASAMITVSSRLFTAQYDLIRRKILFEVEQLRPMEDSILLCISQLAQLYRKPIGRSWDITPIDWPPAAPPTGPKAPAAEQTSGSVERNRSQPIPIPGREPPPLPSEPREMSDALFLASLPPGTDIEAARREMGRPAPRETQPGTEGPILTTHRPGKEPATSEIQQSSSEDSDELNELVTNEIQTASLEVDDEMKGLARSITESIQEAQRGSRAGETAARENQPEEPRLRHRPGKEPVDSEIQPATPDEDDELKDIKMAWENLKEEAKMKSDWNEPATSETQSASPRREDELVDLEQGREEAERREWPQHPCVLIVQTLTNCCTKFVNLCKNFKDMICNIL